MTNLGPDDELEELVDEPARLYPPFFNPVETAGSYVTAAAVLAGFSFTAVILIVGNLEQARPGAFDRAVGALLTAFLGLVLSGFLQAIVAGQMRRSRRTFWLALVAGVSLATSALFALWGVCEIIDVVFRAPGEGRRGENLVDLVSWLFILGSIGIAMLVANVGVNLRRLAGARLIDAWTGCVIWQLIGVSITDLFARTILSVPVTAQTSISRIATIQLIGVVVGIAITVLMASRSGRGQVARTVERRDPSWLGRLPWPSWLPWPWIAWRGWAALGAAVFTYFLVALPAALAWMLLARLPSQPFI